MSRPWNPMTDGPLAAGIVPPFLAPYEDPAGVKALMAGLRAHYAPATILEGMFVEIVASCYWRLARLARAEAGAIAVAQEEAVAANQRRAECLAIAQEDTAAIEGALASGDPERLRAVLDPQQVYESSHDGGDLLALADDQLQRNHADLRDEGSKDPAATCAAAALPDTGRAQFFVRYDAHLRRQLRYALASLKDLQRERRAQASSIEEESPGPAPGDGDPPPRQPVDPPPRQPVGRVSSPAEPDPAPRRRKPRPPAERASGDPSHAPAGQVSRPDPAPSPRRPNPRVPGQRAGGRPSPVPVGRVSSPAHPCPARQPTHQDQAVIPSPIPPGGGTVGGHPTPATGSDHHPARQPARRTQPNPFPLAWGTGSEGDPLRGTGSDRHPTKSTERTHLRPRPRHPPPVSRPRAQPNTRHPSRITLDV